MRFENTEILYLLPLIIIPIIIHLFQLQKFEKTPFTNVAFLRKITSENRKSSTIKKLLILTLRILAFCAIIFAFSSPYLPNKKTNNNAHKIIYIDNSFSMQAKGNEGELLKTAIRKISQSISKNEQYTLATNDELYAKINGVDLIKKLNNLNYSASKSDLKTIASRYFFNQKKTSSKVFLISDFKGFTKENNTEFTNVNQQFNALKVTPLENTNVYIDTAYIKKRTTLETEVICKIKSTNNKVKNTSVSLFLNKKLSSKKVINFDKNKYSEVIFRIPNKEKIEGKIEIKDEYLSFDNTLFFSINNDFKNNIFSIGNEDIELQKIFNKNDFNFTQKIATNLDFNILEKQDLIILNGIEIFTPRLINFLFDFQSRKKTILIIPPNNPDPNSYQKLFDKLNLGKLNFKNKETLKITDINYKHTIFNNVFTKEIQNFQYPNSQKIFEIKSPQKRVLLSFENNSAYVSEIKTKNNSTYIFEGPINKPYSNFKNSPLIVPLLFNIGKQAEKQIELYYYIGKRNEITIKSKNNKLLSINGKNENFNPIQNNFKNKTILTTLNLPKHSGNFNVLENKDTIQNLSYNYNRNESRSFDSNIFKELSKHKNIKTYEDFDSFCAVLKSEKENNTLFKLFLTLAILFLLLEIVIIKFL